VNFAVVFSSFPYILGGVIVTLQYTVCSLLLGIPLGVIIAKTKVSKSNSLRFLSNLYTSVFRGTPLLVQLSIIYLGLPSLVGVSFSVFEAGILAFALNSAAYSSEIIRAGIDSIDKGQWEVAQVLGINSSQSFRFIILPQAIRNILPALVNEMVNLLKETALISVYGGMDLYKRAMNIASEKFLFFEPMLTAAFLYYILVWIFNFCGKKLEKKLKIQN
jgi:His/Glu/Gln/Arg/opine family amino acid ABC transporter permease subunit